MLKNRIRYWRLEMGVRDLNDFADTIGCTTWAVERWEEQKTQPTLEALCRIKEKLLPYYPDITLEALIDYTAEE